MLAPHEILGLPVDANEDEILTVRRVLVRRAQSDQIEVRDASERLQDINSACDAMLASLAEHGRSNRSVDSYTAQGRADASFEAPHRMVPSQDLRRKMEAELLGYTRQLGAAAVMSHAVVDRIDFVENSVRFRLDRRPAPGRVLVAVPRLVQEGPCALRQDSRTVLLEVQIPEEFGAKIRLSQAGARKCVSDIRGLLVEIQLPLEA